MDDTLADLLAKLAGKREHVVWVVVSEESDGVFSVELDDEIGAVPVFTSEEDAIKISEKTENSKVKKVILYL